MERVGGGTGGNGVRIEGIRELVRNLERLGASADDLKDSMQRVGSRAVFDARANTPVGATGALQASVRQSRAKNKIMLRAGTTARTYYASFIEYGTSRISEIEYVNRAADDNAPYLETQIRQELDALIRRYDLN